MARTDETSVAEVYAQALFDLAIERDQVDIIDLEFGEFASQLERDSDFKAFVTARVIDSGQRRKSLDVMFKGKMSDLLLDTLQVLNSKERLEIVAKVRQRYHELMLEHQAITEVQVITAEPLSDAKRTDLQKLMESRTGQTISLVEEIDPSLLGGLIVRVGDEQIDTSVSRQLRRFQETLLQQAEQHIHAGTELFEGATTY